MLNHGIWGGRFLYLKNLIKRLISLCLFCSRFSPKHRYNAIYINSFAIRVIILKFVTAWMFSIILQHYLMWGFIFPNSSVWARSSTTCLNTPNYFPLHCRIACTLLTHHVLASTPFNMFVAFPALTIVIERPLFCLAANFYNC